MQPRRLQGSADPGRQKHPIFERSFLISQVSSACLTPFSTKSCFEEGEQCHVVHILLTQRTSFLHDLSNVRRAKPLSEQSSCDASIWAAAVITAWSFSQEKGALDLAEL